MAPLPAGERVFCVMTPCRNLGLSGPETEMRRLDERATSPEGGGGGGREGNRAGEVDENGRARRGRATVAAAANLQVEQMKPGAAAAAGGWPMRLGTMLPLGRMFDFECLLPGSQGWFL